MKKTFLLVCTLLSVKGSFAAEPGLDPVLAYNTSNMASQNQGNSFSDINTSAMANNELSTQNLGENLDSPKMDEWGWDDQSQMPENKWGDDNSYDSPRMDEWGWDDQSQMPEDDLSIDNDDYDSPRRDDWGWDDQSQMPENKWGDDNSYDSPKKDEWGYDNQSQMPRSRNNNNKFSRFEGKNLNNNYWR